MLRDLFVHDESGVVVLIKTVILHSWRKAKFEPKYHHILGDENSSYIEVHLTLLERFVTRIRSMTGDNVNSRKIYAYGKSYYDNRTLVKPKETEWHIVSHLAEIRTKEFEKNFSRAVYAVYF